MNDPTFFFQVDEEKCIRCGACVKDCAFNALRRAESGRPEVASAARCMRCQHCFAVCPVGAISIDGKDPAQACSTKKLELPSVTAVENWMKTRRSVRRFADADVDRAKLDRILSVLGNAPTGCNARSLTFTCIPTRAAMARFRTAFLHAIENHHDGKKLLPRWLAVPAIRMRQGKEDLFFRQAPGLLIVSSDETNPVVTTPREDVAIACAYFELLAQSHGLATCWCGFLKLVQEKVPELLEAPLGIRRTTPFYAMLFGNPAIHHTRGVMRDDYARIVYCDAECDK